jgi:hypothetical protein
MPRSAGLQTNLTTWLIMAGVTACWMISVRLVPGWRRDGWPSLLKSLYGFVWLGFGLDLLLRLLEGLERNDRLQSWSEVWSLFVLLTWQSRTGVECAVA